MLYKGTVVNNQDPQKFGRVNVQVEGVNTSASDAVLWAEVMGSNDFGLNEQVGFSSVLRVGTQVWVEFQDESTFQNPVIVGVLHGANDYDETVNAEYGKAQVLKTESGHKITISDTGGNERIEILHKTGTIITIDKDGNIIMNGVKDLNIDVKGNISMKAQGNFSTDIQGSSTLQTAGSTTIKTPSTEITGSLLQGSSGGNAEMKGKLDVSGDVTGSGISLDHHTHSDSHGGMTSPPN